MKITDIQIERYGVWQHLALPLRSAGLNVFYGPNEAGKTTLLHFIRDVLYHLPEQNADRTHLGNQKRSWNGALRITHEGRFCEIQRGTETDGQSTVEFQELDPRLAWNTEPDWGLADSSEFDSGAESHEDRSTEESLDEILAQTNATLFRHVFAIGLSELQELSTLQAEEVAQQIYGLSLGLEGTRLLALCAELESSQEQANPTGKHWEKIARLLKRDAELKRELAQFHGQRERHQKLIEEQQQVETEIQDLKSSEAQLQQQLRGHETIKRVWEPWNQVREYESQLRLLPLAPVVSGIDPVRLTELETEARELTKQRKAVIFEIRRLRLEEQQAGQNAHHQELAAEMQGFLNQRSFVVQLEQEVRLSNDRTRELKTEFEARQQALGSEWPVKRLNSIDTSHAAYTRLMDVARAYQSGQARQVSLRKRYDKHSAACHQRQTDLDQEIANLPEKSLDAALDATREQLGLVEELSRLHLQENELEQRLASQNRELERLKERTQIPPWVPSFLLFLAISGILLSFLGFYTGLTSNGITGAILGLVGIAGFAIAKAFRDHSEGNLEEELASVETSIRQNESTLRDVRDSIKHHTPQSWVVSITNAELGNDRVEAVLTAKLSQRISDLKQLESRQKRLHSRRRRLSRMRSAMQTRQKDVAQAKQAWCAELKQCGLAETLQVEAAFELWQKITEAKEHLKAWDTARETAAEVLGRYEAFSHRMADFGHRTGHADLDYNQPLAVMDVWKKELANLGSETTEQVALKNELRDLKREANRLKRKILEARNARSALLAQVGATSREEFEQRQNSAQRRRELEELLELAKMELATQSQAESELAIVEEDLTRYQARQTQEAIELLRMELDDIKTQLSHAFENVGRLKQELQTLESERRPSALRFERELLTGKLKECLEQQAARKLAGRMLQKIRGEFERSCQPGILEVASEYLSKLTCGKYQKIWTTLGEERLHLTDNNQQNYVVEELSNGTREQLFLALRLGMVHDFANRGIELPMVLDDVLVNFDQTRTEAAIETLIEFADRGHQVLLFTSHLHLAKLCEEHRVDPVWLPAHQAMIEYRRAS